MTYKHTFAVLTVIRAAAFAVLLFPRLEFQINATRISRDDRE